MKRLAPLLIVMAVAALILWVTSAPAVDYAVPGQAPEGLTAGTSDFWRTFDPDLGINLVSVKASTADIRVYFTSLDTSNAALNDTIVVPSGEKLNYTSWGVITYFHVDRTSSTVVPNFWAKVR